MPLLLPLPLLCLLLVVCRMLQMDHNFYGPDPNPIYDAVDLRALAEKRAARAALDAEWKRQESLLAKPYSYTLR